MMKWSFKCDFHFNNFTNLFYESLEDASEVLYLLCIEFVWRIFWNFRSTLLITHGVILKTSWIASAECFTHHRRKLVDLIWISSFLNVRCPAKLYDLSNIKYKTLVVPTSVNCIELATRCMINMFDQVAFLPTSVFNLVCRRISNYEHPFEQTTFSDWDVSDLLPCYLFIRKVNKIAIQANLIEWRWTSMPLNLESPSYMYVFYLPTWDTCRCFSPSSWTRL